MEHCKPQVPESPSQVSPSSSNLKGALKPHRHAEQITLNTQQHRKPVWVKLMDVRGSCVRGQEKVWLWYNLAPLVWNIYTYGSHLQKEKQKQKNKQQKTCLWLLLPTTEQTFMELPGNRNWHWVSQVGTKFWVPSTQGEHVYRYDSAGKLWSPLSFRQVCHNAVAMKTLCNAMVLRPAPFPGMTPFLVPYEYSQVYCIC